MLLKTQGGNRMKIFMMTDMEGAAGIVNLADYVYPHSRYYEKAKQLVTMEANAAIEGFFEAGATEIVVVDGHGPGAIEPLMLDKRVLYARGWHGPAYPFGLNNTFDATCHIAQHAKAGSEYAHLAHTGTHRALWRKINGTEVGEYGIMAALAGEMGIPSIFGSGDRAFCKEAAQLTPWTHTVEVKAGVASGKGDECTAEEYEARNNGAIHLHPEAAREKIREGARCALEAFRANPQQFKPLAFSPPFTVEGADRPDQTCPERRYFCVTSANSLLQAMNDTLA